MKRLFSFFPLLLVFLGVLACDLEIPTVVEIRGTPSLKLNVNLDFNELFQDMFDDAFDSEDNEMVVLDCIHDSIVNKTFVISMLLYNEKRDIPEIPSDGDVTANLELVNSKTTLTLGNFDGFLDGFLFKKQDIKSKLFIGGSDIVDEFETTLSYGNPEISIDHKGKTTPPDSGISRDDKEYEESALMSGGIDIDISDYLSKKIDMEMELKIVLPAGNYDPDDFSDATVRVELVIWLPMVFVPEGDEAEFKLPGFEELGNLFSSLAEAEMFKSIKVEVEIAPENPFVEGKLVIRNKNDPVYKFPEREMKQEAFEIFFEKKDLDYINSRENIELEFIILYDNNEELPIQKNLNIMSISIEAEISKRFGEDEENEK